MPYHFLVLFSHVHSSLERVQQDSEEGWFEQENLNEEFSEELAKIAAALNNSFSHWKELQVDGNRTCVGKKSKH